MSIIWSGRMIWGYASREERLRMMSLRESRGKEKPGCLLIGRLRRLDSYYEQNLRLFKSLGLKSLAIKLNRK